MKSSAWKRTRTAALQRARFTCSLCRCGREGNLQVHHRTYVRLGQELQEDLQVLCKVCHELVTEEQRTIRPFERYMKGCIAWIKNQIGDAIWEYDELGQQDGITAAGMELMDRFFQFHPFRG